MVCSSGKLVSEAMYEASEKAGIPHQVCIDGGSDLIAGSTLFCDGNPEMAIIRDVPHKIANLLKRKLTDSKPWQVLTSLMVDIKNNLQQTDTAHLIPPSQRTKSRFMNIELVTRWCTNMLNRLKGESLQSKVSENVFNLFLQLQDMEEYIIHFAHLEKIGSLTRHFIRERGLCSKTVKQLQECLFLQDIDLGACQFAGDVLDFVHQQVQLVPDGEVLVASTEIIESVFGRYKYLQGERSCFGTTRLALYLGGCVGDISLSVIESALVSTPERCINEWSTACLGETFLQARRQAFKGKELDIMEPEMERIIEEEMTVLFS